MPLKDKINKISAVGLVLSAAIIASGYIFDNKELFGFENAMLLYLLLPSALICLGLEKMVVEVVIKYQMILQK